MEDVEGRNGGGHARKNRMERKGRGEGARKGRGLPADAPRRQPEGGLQPGQGEGGRGEADGVGAVGGGPSPSPVGGLLRGGPAPPTFPAPPPLPRVPPPALGRPSERRGCGQAARSRGGADSGAQRGRSRELSGVVELPAQRPSRAARPRPQVGTAGRRRGAGRKALDGRAPRAAAAGPTGWADTRRCQPPHLGSGHANKPGRRRCARRCTYWPLPSPPPRPAPGRLGGRGGRGGRARGRVTGITCLFPVSGPLGLPGWCWTLLEPSKRASIS